MTPTTEAGRRLQHGLEAFRLPLGPDWYPPDAESVVAAILAIEAEARAALLAELAAGVEVLRTEDRSWLAPSELFAAVLDLVGRP